MKDAPVASLVLAWLLASAGAAVADQGHRTAPPAEAEAAPATRRTSPTSPAAPAGAVEEPPAHPWGHGGLGHLASWLGKLHPVAVHFPIALLLGAVAAEALLALGVFAWCEGAVRFCVAGGALLAPVVAALGWLAAGPLEPDEDWLVAAHRWSGSATALLALAALVASEHAARSGSRGRLRLALALVAAGLVATGFLGGALVHGIDHLAWPAP